MRVKATREGLVGDETSSGWHIDTVRMFVALPARKALFRWVNIKNPLNGKTCRAEVLDVGPFNINDNGYVFGGLRPLSESGSHVDETGKTVMGVTNGSGIDLGEAVWLALGMLDNTQVDWTMEPIPGDAIAA